MTIFNICIYNGCAWQKERLYEQTIDGSLEDKIEYDNTVIAVAREKNDIQKQIRIIEESYAVYYEKLVRKDTLQSIAYNISCLKMAHMLRMNLDRYMEAVVNMWDDIQSIWLPQKYFVMKELFLLLIEPPEVHPNFVRKYETVFTYVQNYIESEASSELERYCEELPSEAVFARGHTFQELAWLQKWKMNYNFDAVINYLRAGIDLFRSQSQRLEAIFVSGSLIDELVAQPNLLPDFSPKYPEILKTELDNLTSEMEHVRSHAGIAEVYLRIAFGYIYLKEYKEADKYYHKFLLCKINPNHYSVWLKANLQFIEVTCRLWRIKKALLGLKRTAPQDRSLSKGAREWLANYPDISSEEMVVLLSIALDREFVSAKVVRWGEKTKSGILLIRQHWWLLYGDDIPLGDNNSILEIDCCYDQISEKDEKDQILFLPQMHPLQARNRKWVLEHVNHLVDYPVSVELKMERTSSFHDERGNIMHEIGERLQKIVSAENTLKSCL